MNAHRYERRRGNWIQRQSWRPWVFTALIFLLAWQVAQVRFAAPPALAPIMTESEASLAGPERPSSALASSGQAAVLALDGRAAGPAARALRAAGVPYAIVVDPAAARLGRMIVIPLDDRAAPLEASEEAAYKAWVSNGGVLVLQAPAGGDLWRSLTGLERTLPAQTRRRLTLRQGEDSAEERVVVLAGSSSKDAPWTTGLRPAHGAAEVLAVFDDREPAITRRKIGAGRVYVLGATLADLYARPLAARHFEAAADPRGGAFESGADFAPDLLRAWAASAFPASVRLRSLPGRAAAVLCVSHDLGDALLGDVAAFAAEERSAGVRAAWFTRTGLPTLDARRTSFLREAAALGHEIGSRGESLPPDFDALPLGDETKDLRTYSPKTSGERSWDATLLGETAVSRTRLKSQTGVDAEGFRGPPASRPVLLDEALARAGFLYDAGVTAAEVLTHRPFLLPARRGFEGESRVIALPTGLPESAKGAPSPSRVLALLARVSAHEGVLSWNLRPDAAGLAALKGTLARLPAGTAVMTPGEAARRAFERTRTRFWLEDGAGKTRTLAIEVPEGGAKELSFEVRGLRSCVLASGPGGASVSCEGRLAVVSSPSAGRLLLRLDLE